MPIQRQDGDVQPGISWGPFTLRIPFVHTGFELPEVLQGLLVAAATGLALVPVLTDQFALTFEEAVLMSFYWSFLISSGPILFGEPFAPGWITPALPLALQFVLSPQAFASPQEKFQVMTALSMDLALILLLLGATGLGRILVDWLPGPLKSAIIMGAAISAFKRVFLDTASTELFVMPWSMSLAMGLCLLLSFSVPVQRYKQKWPWLARLASLGLLPGFVVAGIVGVAVGELSFTDASGASIIQNGFMTPPFAALHAKVSPLVLGLPLELMMNTDVIALAFAGYIILFGDIVTGTEVLRESIPARPDEKVEFNSTRTHLSTGIRNAIMAVIAPFFPTQGSLWTGVHVIIVRRWAEGRQAMDSLFSGISSYYLFGVPVLFFYLPIVTGLRPFMPIALALTLILTGFACAYVAMAIPRHATERGVVLLGGTAIALLSPFLGMAVAFIATFALLGLRPGRPEPSADSPEPAS